MAIETSIIAGGVVVKNDKFLLIQEGKAKCYGKWSLPAGHLEASETLFEGAKREIKEETNCEVELTGICQIGTRKRPDDIFVSIVFTTQFLSGSPKPQPGEILALDWFTYEEVVNMRDELRAPEFIIKAIENYRNDLVAPINLVEEYKQNKDAYEA